MQPYPPGSGSGLAGLPAWHGLRQCLGYGHWVSYRCVARALGFEVRPSLAPPDLGQRFGTCPGLGFCLSASCLGQGLRCVRVDAGCAWFAPARLEFGVRVFGGYESRGVAPFPPFSAGGSGVCSGVCLDVAPPFLVGFAGGARGLGFRLQPASLALAVWRVVLSGFSLTPARGVLVPWLGCVVALCGAGGPSTVPGACFVRCVGPSSTWVVVRPCASPEGRCRLQWGVAWGSPWAPVSPPLVLFFSGLSDGEPSVGRGWLVSPVSGRAPPPLRMTFFFRPRGR